MDWLGTSRFYLLFIFFFLLLRHIGFVDKKYETADVPIRLAVFYMLFCGIVYMFITSNHGTGYGRAVSECTVLFCLSCLHLFHRPRKALKGMLLSVMAFGLFYAYDYFNVWTDYEVWTDRGMPDRFEPPFGHRWWWEK